MALANIGNLQNLEDNYRKNLINSFTGFKSVSLLGSIDEKGMSNLAIFSQIIHVGAHPPLIGILFRPPTVKRGTLENILNTKFFTINHIREDFYQEAHQTSARYEESEFDACGLEEEYLNDFPAPFVKEAYVKASASYVSHYEIKENGTIFLIAELQQLYIPEEALGEDGFIALETAGTITCTGLDTYHRTTKIARLSYAKPGKKLEIIG